MRRRLLHLVTPIVAAGISAVACTPDETAPAPVGAWRLRLRTALFERTARDGTRFGLERLDPLLADDTRYLLTGPSHTAALATLDEFVADVARGARLAAVERALIQRDLWTVYDWAIDPVAEPGPKVDLPVERTALCDRIAGAMKAVALTPEEIAALPDVYATTVASAAHPTGWDPDRPMRAFLPADLFDPAGPWVCLGDPVLRSLTSTHRRDAFGHAAFALFVRLPEGRAATLAWVAKAAAALAPRKGADAPAVAATPLHEPPRLTQFAVVRRTLLLDRAGQVHTSPLVERVEMRVHGADVTLTMPGSTAQHPPGPAPFEWHLDGPRLLRGERALVATREDDGDLPFFEHGKGGDHFENFDEPHPIPSRVLVSCLSCRSGSLGIHAVLSLGKPSHTGEAAALEASTIEHEFAGDVAEKAGRADWKRLRAQFEK